MARQTWLSCCGEVAAIWPGMSNNMAELFVVEAIWPGRHCSNMARQTCLSCLWLLQYGQARLAELFVVAAIWPGRHG